MKKFIRAVSGLLFAVLTLSSARAGDSTWVYSVQVSAAVQVSPPRITLTWPADPYGANTYTVHRKAMDATVWGPGTTLPGSATSFVDATVAAGSAYEYQVVKQASLGYTGYGYIHAGIQAPLVENRGKVILVVDNTHTTALAFELSRLQQDLVGDGWTVIRRDVSRTATPAQVRNVIQTEYSADPANVKAVFLFGRVPVLRSGNLNVDGHQARPMPADVFYGEMNGNWTDGNGDGIYDQNTLPSDVELQVGRVDFANMPGNGLGYPGEVELLRRYLDKDHHFRHGRLNVPRRGLVGNRFGDFGGEAFAASGYRNFAAFFGATNTITANTDDNAPLADRWISRLTANEYLWAYGCGGGAVSSMSGLGTHGPYSDVWSIDLVGQEAKAVFYMMFGSWLGDWDTTDNIMRSGLAAPDYGLTCSWSGRPHHFYHHMALGETVGYGIRLSQNNSGLYRNQANSQQRGIHIALMGDPTLRMHPVQPPSGLITTPLATSINLTWLAPAESVAGYHVYRATSAAGPFTRLTSSPITALAFLDTSAPAGDVTYMVRAVKLETSASGTYFNASQGVFQSVGGSSTPVLPVVTVTASDASAAEAGTDPGRFTVSRTGSTALALVVNFTLGGTATSGADYQSPGTSVTIPPGAASAGVTITPVDDALVEGSETVVLTLANGVGYNPGSPGSATVTIADNDSAPAPTTPTITVVASDATAVIGSPTDTAAFTFTRTGATSQALTVTYTLGGTAVKWVDYRRPEGDMPVTFTIPSGASSANMTIVGITNATAANPHTVVLTLANDTAYVVGTPSSATVTLQSASVPPPPPPPPADTNTVVWVEDALPAGAGAGTDGPAWSWVSASPAPFSGAKALQSGSGTGLHQHYFDWASETLTVNSGESLVVWVQLDPANPPEEIMLQWNNGNWEHRAYWGANRITYGANDTAARRFVGALPAAGQWVKLEVPASQVGLEGSTLKGMAFSLFGGRATFDRAGKSLPATTPPPSSLPVVTVTATDATATIGGVDNGEFTFTRTGSTGTPLTVDFLLGGSAIKWIDYRRPEGDMPVKVTIPAGAVSTKMTIVAITNSTAANPHTVLLALATNAAYSIGSPGNATVTIQGGTAPPTNPAALNFGTNQPAVSVVDYTTLELPKVGDHTLHVLSPTVLELVRVNTKQPDPARVDSWDFVDTNGAFNAPAATRFAVTVGGQPVSVQAVGFKRRPLYAPLAKHDLRIASTLVLQLASPVADGQTVEVTNPDATLWPAAMRFVTTAEALRYSPAIHVNQEGYVPQWPKQAMIGHYLGSLGELDVTATQFHLVDVATGDAAFTGGLTPRPDVGYTYTPAPYQKVFEADFTAFTTPGEYRLFVPGLGASLPFLIDDGIAMAFTRAYALGLYNQRCGTECRAPFTRHEHGACHTAPAAVPVPQGQFAFTWSKLAENNADFARNPRHTAPQLKDEASQLYPFVNTGPVDVARGHHDAGDYSKYTINSAGLVHYLMFAVDSFPGVAALDNLGLPESGDGVSDLLQEAKWEADFLAKMQDADGGFYFLVYPRNRAYESNVLPDQGDPQVVWPKNTAATAASVAALAQTASSPAFKQRFPAEAALYLQKAQLGWQFLTNAIARHGRDGAYQKITHYGHEFMHDDELAWAACELFLATGNPVYQQKLFEWFPNPADPATHRWGWWRMWESYGRAVRSYAFAARSGRLASAQLNAGYLAVCEAEVLAAAEDHVARAEAGAYGSSFPLETKRVRGAGWFFSSERAFDITVGYQLDPRPAFHKAVLDNLNYEAGVNPVNVSYVTGMGWKRQREIVHQYAQNDRRVLPPGGIPLGNIQQGFMWVSTYGTELRALTFPNDDATTAPYPFYDRWADTFNVSTEFVHLDQARAVASLAFFATLTPSAAQSWTPPTAQIAGLPAEVGTNAPVTATLLVPGLDLNGARIVWEARDQEPQYGPTFNFAPVSYGPQWVEAEAQWPDGRRVVASAGFFATNTLPTVTVTASDATATIGTADHATFTFARTGDLAGPLTVNFKFSGTAVKWIDYRRPEGDMPETVIIPAGAAFANLTILALTNATAASPHTVVLTLQPSSDHNVGTPDRATVTLLGSGAPPSSLPTVSVTASDPDAARVGQDTGAFTVTRTGSTAAPLTANFSLGGTAVNGVDYVALPLSVTLPIGASSASVTLTPLASSSLVGTKTVVLTLSDHAAYTVGAAKEATVTITGNTVPTSSIKASGSSITVTWASVAGRSYRVAAKNSLTDPVWTEVSGVIVATGTSTSWKDSEANRFSQRYYVVYAIN